MPNPKVKDMPRKQQMAVKASMAEQSAFKMKGFSGFKSSPLEFKPNGQDNLKGHSTKKRAKMGRANKMLERLGMEGLKSKDLQPLKNKTISKIDMTLNDNLNKAVRKSEAKEFLRKNTIKPKVKKPLSRPFGPGTRPLARNVSKGLKAFGRRIGVVGAVAGVKDIFDSYGKMGKTKTGKRIIKDSRMQPGKI